MSTLHCQIAPSRVSRGGGDVLLFVGGGGAPPPPTPYLFGGREARLCHASRPGETETAPADQGIY